MELLFEGSKGSAVMQLQQILLEIGYVLEPNGVYCNKVTEIVIHFQHSVSIEANGMVNDITWAFLVNVLELKKRNR